MSFGASQATCSKDLISKNKQHSQVKENHFGVSSSYLVTFSLSLVLFVTVLKPLRSLSQKYKNTSSLLTFILISEYIVTFECLYLN